MFGNAVFIDCTYVYVTLIKSIKAQVTPEMFDGHTELYNNVTKALDRIDEYVSRMERTFCDYAFEMDGMLKDQASYYISSYEDILTGVS